MNIECKVTGYEELMSVLERMGRSADESVNRGLREGARRIQASAKDLCPENTGALRNSIKVTKIDGGYDIGTNVDYAVYQEYGTGLRGDSSVRHVTEKEHKKKGKGTGEFYQYQGIPPKPFLYPALKMHEKDIPGIVRNTIIKDAMRR